MLKKKILIPAINKSFKILHISNFGIKNNHRLFNLSIAKKISNGFIYFYKKSIFLKV